MIGRTAQAEKQPKLQHHIVFLDDEADTISLKPTVAALERAFNVTIMTSPDELISFLTKVSISIDILLLDMIFLTKTLHPLLLDVSGLEMGLTLLELIRSGRFGDRYRKLPVLVLTASTIPDTMEKIKILSQDSNTSVIYKPCSPSHIVKEVQNIINGRL
jgi:CheY-like chemotaxis protein